MKISELLENREDPPLPTKVYHTSKKRNRGSIKKLGLIPKTKEFKYVSRNPGVFCLETLEQAKDWAYYYALDEKEPMDIYEVTVADTADLNPDPSREMQEIYDSWVIYKPVPPQSLRIVATQDVPDVWRSVPPNIKVRNLEED